jgi:DHA1 family multidrug resistance protein-like MFS transporter
VTAQICVLTFAVYIGSAIYSPAVVDTASHFHVSRVTATLGLSLFVAGYGLGETNGLWLYYYNLD